MRLTTHILCQRDIRRRSPLDWALPSADAPQPTRHLIYRDKWFFPPFARTGEQLYKPNNVHYLNICYGDNRRGCSLPPVGHTLPVQLVREPKDPSRHSVVVQSFWVMVGSSCSKLAFWL
ncbi:hypothetical protein EYF80_039412 [Liparis tanakae]|uniref:Uncharacterized protein n=1 Tax=Liparis tanakae TaxID=230148 RepID=A0A4Z2G9Z5_9TELE|nr:hypothetical protein EYF80_039412 [Liparis tanakae]